MNKKSKTQNLSYRLRRFTLITFVFFVASWLQHSYAEEALTNAEEASSRVITIPQGIAIVLKDSRLLKITLPDNEMAYYDSLIARSALLPHFSLSATKSYLKFQPASKFDSQTVNTSEKDPFSYGFDVYQTLFDFGKNLFNYRAAKEMTQVYKAHTESVKRIATLEFIVAYFDLLEAEKMITVFEKEVESLTSYLNDIEHLYEQGVVVKNDLLPAKLRLADVKQKLIAARNEREIVAARLNNILALPLREKIVVQDMQMSPPKFPELDDAWKTAQASRPEVTFYQDQIQASMLSEKAKAVENFPIIFADGGYSNTQNRYQVHQDNFQAVLGAKVDLYDGGVAKGQLLKERSRQKQLKEQKEKLIEDIKLEIEDSYFVLRNSCEKVAVANDALAQAEENVRVYRAKYNAGSATPTEVLEAITQQTMAQTNYYNDDYELKRSYAKLMYSMGIDLTLIYEKMESGQNGPTKQ
jgi:outer membrane protein